MKKIIEINTSNITDVSMEILNGVLPDITKVDHWAISSGITHALESVPNEVMELLIAKSMANEVALAMKNQDLADLRKQTNERFNKGVGRHEGL